MKRFQHVLIIIILLLLFTHPLFSQWIRKAFPNNENLNRVRFISENTGWVLGSNYVYKTIDGGDTWFKQDSIWDEGTSAVYAINSETALYGNIKQGIVLTTDGGSTWNVVNSSKYYYMNFNFVNSNLGFVSAGGTTTSDSGFVLRTTDGGKNWATIAAVLIGKRNYDFEKLSFVDSLNGWAVTYGAKIYHTTDGGFNWAFQDSIANTFYLPFRDIQFVNQNLGWAVGGIAGNSIIAKTSNGGQTWSSTILSPDISVSSIQEFVMLNSQNGWFVGSSNGPAYIAKTTDGGDTWINETPSNELNGLKSISIVNDSVGYAVGDNGKFYKRIGNTITSVSDENKTAANNFRIEQNYPNPFNPSTKIKYYLPNESKVTIKIYNSLAKEVETLYDSFQNAGTHEIEWNAKNFVSGIYFFQIKANGFVSTKKMILLK